MTRPQVAIDKLRKTRTEIMVNLGNPKPDAFESYMLKSKGKTVATRRAIGEKPAGGNVCLIRRVTVTCWPG
jgi:hypothetical protein